MMLWVVVGLAVLASLYTLFVIGVAWVCLHPPRVPVFLSPGALGLPQASVGFTSSDGVNLRGWWIDREDPSAVIVFCHGYLMNRAEPVPLAKRLFEEGCACLVFDFRAHGASGGKCSTIGDLERHDVAAALNHARARYPDSPIVIWGSSMGGSAAALALADGAGPAAGLILDSSYSRLVDANEGWWETFVGRLKPFFRPVWVGCWLLSGRDPRYVDTAAALRTLGELPVLLLYGTKDLIVPREQIERNAAACKRGELAWFENVQHSQARWYLTQDYDRALLTWLNREVLNLSEPPPNSGKNTYS